MSFSAYVSLFIVHFMAVAIPGPSFFFITQTAFKYGKHNALMATLGASLGVLVWITLALAGIIVLIRHVPLLHTGLTLLGSLYLLWLAQSMICSALSRIRRARHGHKALILNEPDMLKEDHRLKRPPALWRSMGKAVLVELSNPKSMIYFSSVLSSFLRPDLALHDMLAVGSMMALIMPLWFVPVSLLFSTASARALYYRKAHWVDMGAGIIFTLLSLHILHSLWT